MLQDFLVPPNTLLQPQPPAFYRNVTGDHEQDNFLPGSTIRVWHNTESRSFSMHWHSAVEIILPIENQYTVVTTDTRYILNPGEVLVIPPGDLHELIAPSSGSRMIYLFDFSKISQVDGFSSILPFFTSAIHLSEHDTPSVYRNVLHLLLHMRDEYFGSSPLRELAFYSLVMELFVNIGREQLAVEETVSPAASKKYLDKFTMVFSYIDSHYTEDISLEQLAKLAGYSKFHFTRLFKQYADSTFYDYLCYKRIRVAEDLLSDPRIPITEIALQVGFSSISTFNRTFKKLKNCTPSEYRALYYKRKQ